MVDDNESSETSDMSLNTMNCFCGQGKCMYTLLEGTQLHSDSQYCLLYSMLNQVNTVTNLIINHFPHLHHPLTVKVTFCHIRHLTISIIHHFHRSLYSGSSSFYLHLLNYLTNFITLTIFNGHTMFILLATLVAFLFSLTTFPATSICFTYTFFPPFLPPFPPPHHSLIIFGNLIIIVHLTVSNSSLCGPLYHVICLIILTVITLSSLSSPSPHCHHPLLTVFLLLTILLLLLQQKEDEVNQLKQEMQRLNRMRDAVQRRLRLVEDQKGDTEQQREVLKNQITALEKGDILSCPVHQ